jgi:hypothetical protein
MQLSPPHRRFHAKTILKTLGAIACLILVISRVQSSPSIRQLLFDEEVQYGFPTPRDVSYQPKISLIGVWAGNEEPNYLTWFLESIARQPDEVELLVIQRGRNLGNFGGDAVAKARNIKVIKMSDDRCKFPHPPETFLGDADSLRRLGLAQGIPLPTMGMQRARPKAD